MILLYIVFIVYIAAVNLYAVMLLKAQRDENGENEKPVGDGKLILCAIMGGAIGIYATMFILKYRLKNLLFMAIKCGTSQKITLANYKRDFFIVRLSALSNRQVFLS